MSGTETKASAFPDAPSAVPRVCLIAPDGPLVMIQMALENELRAAGRFWLLDPIYRPGRYPLLKWEMATGEKGEIRQRVGVHPADLGLHSLSFTIRTCSKTPDVTAGTIRIRVFQDADECTILPPAVFHRENVPECEGNDEPDWLHNGFVFAHRG